MIEGILLCVGVSIAMVVFVGIPYVKGARQHSNHRANNKRDYVVANLDKFKVSDVCSSMDDKEIYLISRERMGFK